MIDGSLLPLLVKMLATGLVVVAASAAAERAGPLLGGLIASLPVAAGPGYVFLALEAPEDFVAASAVMSLAANAAIPPFLLVFTRVAPHAGAVVSTGAALLVWLALAPLLRLLDLSIVGVALLNLASFGLALGLIRVPPATHARSLPRQWYELPLRGLLVGLLVAVVTTSAQALGPAVTGIAVVFPVAFTSLALVLHLRLGGSLAAATLGGALKPMIGFTLALLAFALAIAPFGVWPALAGGLAVSLAASAALLLWNRHRP